MVAMKSRPTLGVQPTAYSVRSCLAPAVRQQLTPALDSPLAAGIVGVIL